MGGMKVFWEKANVVRKPARSNSLFSMGSKLLLVFARCQENSYELQNSLEKFASSPDNAKTLLPQREGFASPKMDYH